jgi:hypothetical protein
MERQMIMGWTNKMHGKEIWEEGSKNTKGITERGR